MQQEPLDEKASYDDVATALLASEQAIYGVFSEYFKPNKPLTRADFFWDGYWPPCLGFVIWLSIDDRTSQLAMCVADGADAA